MVKHEFIKKNMTTLRKLFKNGDLSSKVMIDYKIYNTWKSNAGIKSSVERYRTTAIDENVCSRTVRRAVKNMTSQFR